MQFLSVKPAPGRSPRHESPPHAPIKATGELVPATPYYLRQLEVHGDTVNADPHPGVIEHLELVEPDAEILDPPASARSARAKSKPSRNQKEEA